MPFNFLELLTTYRTSGIPRATRVRRDAVARELNNEYGCKPLTASEIVSRLAVLGISANVNNIHNDVQILKTAYDYLTAETGSKQGYVEKVASILKKREQNPKQGVPTKLFGIWCLMQDGTTTWDQVLQLLERYQQEHPQQERAEEDKESSASEQAAEEKRTEEGAAGAVDPQALARQAIHFMDQGAHVFRSIVEMLTYELTETQHKLAQAELSHTLLTQELKHAHQELESACARAQEWGDYAHELDERLKAISQDQLEVLAERAAAENGKCGVELLRAVQRFLDTQSREEAARVHKNVLALLPGVTSDGRSMEYEEQFITDLQGFEERDHDELIDALDRFAKHGEQYPSLETKRWPGKGAPGVPDGSFKSRSSVKFRFFWKQDGSGTIRFYRAGPHTEFSASGW